MTPVTRAEIEAILAELSTRLPREECRTCDCVHGFLTQLELDAAEDVSDLMASWRIPRSDMHGCLGCEPCPPAESYAEFIRSRQTNTGEQGSN